MHASKRMRTPAVWTIAGRPQLREGAPTSSAGSFDEASDRTGSFAEGVGDVARFRCPMGAAQAADGTIYVTDWGNHCIRALRGGVWSTLAGKPGEPGFQDGPGSLARFNHVARITIDWETGDLIVSDRDNHAIRRIILIQDGNMAVVATIAGGGHDVSCGVAGYLDAEGMDARFNSPVGVAVGLNGDIFVGDLCNHCIRAVSRTGEVRTLAGLAGERAFADGIGSSARFLFPRGIAIDKNNTLIVTDAGNHAVRRITLSGIVTTIAGSGGEAGHADGAGNSARFNFPGDVAIDGTGVVVVADTVNHCVRTISLEGEVATVAGTPEVEGFSDSDVGLGGGAHFSHPSTLFIDATGAIIVADTYNHSIRQVGVQLMPLNPKP
jgi:sugar lactone lactonase YvrE